MDSRLEDRAVTDLSKLVLAAVVVIAVAVGAMVLVLAGDDVDIGGVAPSAQPSPGLARETILPGASAGEEGVDAPAADAPSVLQVDVAAPEQGTPLLSREDEVAQASLSGNLVDPTGRPVPGARIVYHADAAAVFFRRFGSQDASPPPRAETLTDRNGHFLLTVSVSDKERDDEDDAPFFDRAGARVVASHGAFTVLVQDCPMLEVGSEVDLGTLSMDMGSQVGGRVVNEAGRPVRGAEVTVRSRGPDPGGRSGFMAMLGGRLVELYTTAMTDANGRFYITGVQPGLLSVSGEADGYQVGVLSDLESEPGLTLAAGDLVLSEGASIAGWIVDRDGEPVEGAQVRVSSMARLVVRRMGDVPRQQLGQEMRLRAETDADGYFALNGLGLGQYTVHVDSDGHEDAQKENVVAGTPDLSITLDKLGGLLVSVRSALDDGMVDGAKITANASPQGRFWMNFGNELEILEGEQAVAASGIDVEPDGMYFVQGAGSTGTELQIQAEGFAAASITAPSVGPDSVVEFDVLLSPESVIAGIVLDSTGLPIAQAEVRLAEYVAPPTMSGGRLEINREVRRHFGGDGADADGWKRTRSDENGAFALRGIPEGDWELTASADGYAGDDPAVVTLTTGDSIHSVEITMLEAGSIVGIVLEEDGRPVKNASITVTPFDSTSGASGDSMGARMAARMAALMGNDDTRRASSDLDGNFEVKDLLPGLYDVKLAKQQGGHMGGAMMLILDGSSEGLGEGERVEVLAREEAWVELVRSPTASLSGFVLAGGRPVPGVSVQLDEANSFMPFGGRAADTDSTGRYTFEDVEPGKYEVSAIVSGAALPEELAVDLVGGMESQADLVFSGSTVSGQVVDSDTGDGVSGVTINLTSDAKAASGFNPTRNVSMSFVTASTGGRGSGMTIEMGGGDVSKVRTNRDGFFRVEWVKPGAYGIETQGGGYTTAKAGPFDVDEGHDVEDIEIEADRGAVLSGSVVSFETGQLVDAAPVRLETLDGSDMQMGLVEAGRYEFEGLVAGDYVVSVLGSGFGSAPLASETISLTKGEMRTLDLTTSAAGVPSQGGGGFFGFGGHGSGDDH